MKINKYFFTGLGFITGTVFGISVIGLLSFTSAPVAPVPASGNNAVTSAVAHAYFSNYMADATPLNQVVRGFTVDKTQVDAMNSISSENPGLTSFRIYLGKDNGGNKVGIVVGVDNAGRDAVGNSIFSTDAPRTSPCPPICDVASPIAGSK